MTAIQEMSLDRDPGKKRTCKIFWRDLGAPTGEFGANFSSYLGWYLRETVPCTLMDWGDADEETIKIPVWNHMKVQFCFSSTDFFDETQK